MNVYENARLTPAGRAVMIRRIEEEGWPVKRAAEASGVSTRTAYTWLGRHRRGVGVGVNFATTSAISIAARNPGA